MNLQKNTILLKSEIKLDKFVNHVAKSLSLLLNNKAVRETFAAEIENSTNKHKIIDLIDLLKKNPTINSKSVKLLDKLLENIDEKDKNDFKNSINNIPSKYLFLGFPSQKQRDQWITSEDVLVAAVGDRLDGDESDVIAYNSKGQKIDLAANELPLIPTLVVRTDESLTKKLTSALLPGEGGGAVVDQQPHNMMCILKDLKLEQITKVFGIGMVWNYIF